YSDTFGVERRACRTTSAISGAASPRPRSSGDSQTPWIWAYRPDTEPRSDLNTTRPSATTPKARRIVTRVRTYPRYVAGLGSNGETPTSSVYILTAESK